jgi:hypothetical protein
MGCPTSRELVYAKRELGTITDDDIIKDIFEEPGSAHSWLQKNKDKKKYIYESPDNGKTLYRRKFNDYDTPKELIKNTEDITHSKYYYETDRNKSFKNKKPIVSKDLELKYILDALTKAESFNLNIEVVWSSLKAMKDTKGEISILTALQMGLNEWDI